jgi:hypothetical protein
MKRSLQFSLGWLLILTALVAAYCGGYRAGFDAARREAETVVPYEKLPRPEVP